MKIKKSLYDKGGLFEALREKKANRNKLTKKKRGLILQSIK